jgi:hypothetical protein
MKKDIDIRKVEDIAVAMVPRLPGEEDHELFWDAYLLNFKEETIRSILVNSRSYGEIEGEKRQSATFRHFWEHLGPLDLIRIEPVPTELFVLANEFWISFSHDGYLYDRKYVFVQGSLDPMNFTDIPFLDKQGVMIL